MQPFYCKIKKVRHPLPQVKCTSIQTMRNSKSNYANISVSWRYMILTTTTTTTTTTTAAAAAATTTTTTTTTNNNNNNG